MSVTSLGIIGSGQLGSLLCQAAKKLNIRTVVISDDKELTKARIILISACKIVLKNALDIMGINSPERM